MHVRMYICTVQLKCNVTCACEQHEGSTRVPFCDMQVSRIQHASALGPHEVSDSVIVNYNTFVSQSTVSY